MVSAICLVGAATSRAAIWMSDGAPRNPALPWWIIRDRCEQKELGNDQVGDLIIDLPPKEDDPVAQEAG
jgi:hypothetical protein